MMPFIPALLLLSAPAHAGQMVQFEMCDPELFEKYIGHNVTYLYVRDTGSLAVAKGRIPGCSMVMLTSGKTLSVKGEADEVKQKIEGVKK